MANEWEADSTVAVAETLEPDNAVAVAVAVDRKTPGDGHTQELARRRVR